MKSARNEPRPERAMAARKISATQQKLQRGAVGLVLFVILALAIAATVAGSARKNRPDVALAVRPADAYAAAQLTTWLQPGSRLVGPEGLLEELARSAVLSDPTAVRATRALALTRDEAGRVDEAVKLASYSDSLTRRDLAAQMYLVEHHFREGNFDRMFEHFEAAASTSRQATSVLFPMIAAAIGEPEVAGPLTALLAREPWWAASMLSTIAQGAGPADAGARLFIGLSELGHPPRADIAETLLRRLEDEGERALAAQLRQAVDLEPTSSLELAD